MEILPIELSRGKASYPITFVMIDIDGFKKITTFTVISKATEC